ncbi:hypothetical protein FQA47_012829 [Oryzias melastigma]|uniref:Uncharacterized protein n=1 Tax=Oryzias melastigma TaxID=30732 RepID=A0A834FA52_ORYME|nr:hypothetical protein FQA47_012829 [Oryzias melastigma]
MTKTKDSPQQSPSITLTLDRSHAFSLRHRRRGFSALRARERSCDCPLPVSPGLPALGDVPPVVPKSEPPHEGDRTRSGASRLPAVGRSSIAARRDLSSAKVCDISCNSWSSPPDPERPGSGAAAAVQR